METVEPGLYVHYILSSRGPRNPQDQEKESILCFDFCTCTIAARHNHYAGI